MNLLQEIRNKIKALLDERATKEAELKAIVDGAEERGDGNLTEEEQKAFSEVRAAISDLDEKRAAAEAREKELEADEESREKADEARKKFEKNPTETTEPRVDVKSPTTYRDGGSHSFFGDAFRAFGKSGSHDFAAADRLKQHQREMEVLGMEARNDPESRDVGTGAFGALVVPQYLVDEFAAVLRNGRAYINAIRSEPLPAEGMSIIIPRGQTGVTVAPQATENAAVSETDVDYDDDLTIPVRTFAGQQDVSRQSLERGTAGIDRLIYNDLVAAYAAALDASAINDDGTSGTHLGLLNATGVNSVTYTDATPTVAEAYPKLADSVQQVATNRKMAATLWVMHPRRWGWFLASVDGQQRPLVVPDAGQARNAMGTAAENFGEGQLVGMLQGLPVLVDANIPTNLGGGTNEDRIFGVRASDQIIWEEGNGMPKELAFEETAGGNLTVKLVVYGYSAFTAERYANAVSIIAGTGLVAPTF